MIEIPMLRNPAPAADARALRRIVKLLKRCEFDVVHTHSSKAGFLGRLAGKLAGFEGKLVHTPHVFPFQQPFRGAQRAFYVALERKAAAWTDVFILLTRYQRLLALQTLGVPSEKTALIPNGVDTDYFKPADRDGCREGLGLAREAFVATFAGRSVYQKGLDLLLSAAEQLGRSKAGKGVVILYAGEMSGKSDPLYGRLKQLEHEGLLRSVGELGDVRPAYGASDVVVVPSRWEGMPYVVLEAMAMQKPIIASAVSGLHEVLPGPPAAIIIPPSDAEALTDAILAVKAKGLIDERAKTELRDCACRYPLARQIGAHEKVYASLSADL